MKFLKENQQKIIMILLVVIVFSFLSFSLSEMSKNIQSMAGRINQLKNQLDDQTVIGFKNENGELQQVKIKEVIFNFSDNLRQLASTTNKLEKEINENRDSGK